MPKKVLMGNSMTQDQWEDQETDGRMLFRGMHYRCYGYDDGGEELKTGRNGGIFWGRPRPGRGCSAIHGWTDLLARHVTDSAALNVRILAINWRGWEWNKSVAAMFQVMSQQSLKQTEKNHKEDLVRIFGAAIETLTRHRPNTIQKRYCFGQLVRFSALTKRFRHQV